MTTGKQVGPLILIGEILIMVSAIFWCFTLIGMIWGIPMTIGCVQRIKGEKEITVLHLVLSFLFFGFIGAILSTIGWSLEKNN